MREILIVAGETSGDGHAAAVVRALKAHEGKFAFVGVGGNAMRDAGVELLDHVENLAVMGFVEPLKRLPHFRRLRNSLRARIEGGKVALLILVDFGGFNLGIAGIAARAKVPVLYYITPQVWASREGRVARLAKSVSRAAVILPFEEAFLRKRGVNATFVGHPLAERVERLPDRASARRELGVAEDANLLSIFPGSREQEIRRHLGPFVEAAKLLQQAIPALEVRVGAAPHVHIDALECPYPLVRTGSLLLLRASDAALCKSGTTTVEAAVAGCPLVVGYRTDAISYAIAKRVIRIPYIAMVNVLAGRRIVPEFVQGDLQPARVARSLETLLDDSSEERHVMLEALASVRDSLGTAGAAERVAVMALELLSAA